MPPKVKIPREAIIEKAFEFTEIWVVMPWDVDAEAFHEVADWLDSRCRFNE